MATTTTTRAFGVAALCIAAIAFAGCAPAAAPDPTEETPAQPQALESAVFSQSQSTPGFDSATYRVEDDASLAELEALLNESGVGRGDYSSSGQAAPDAMTTSVAATWDDGTTSWVEVWASDSDFESQFQSLITGWRESGEFEQMPVP